jgi:hypothetical protein
MGSKRHLEGRAKVAMEVIARRGRDGASAFEIGKAIAAARRPRWTVGHVSGDQKEALGLAEGARLVRDGLAVATRENRFMLARFEARSVAPSVRLEDQPPPGFVRVPSEQGH